MRSNMSVVKSSNISSSKIVKNIKKSSVKNCIVKKSIKKAIKKDNLCNICCGTWRTDKMTMMFRATMGLG